MVKESFQEQHEKKVIEMLSINNISIIDLILIKRGYILVDNTKEYDRTYSKETTYNGISVKINIILDFAYTDVRDKIKVVYELSLEIEIKGEKINKVNIMKPDNDNTDRIKYLATELNNYLEYLGI